MITRSMVQVSTSAFQFAHGRKPSGRGFWFFFTDKAQDDFDTAIQFNGTYGEAKKHAQKVAAERGVDQLYVGT